MPPKKKTSSVVKSAANFNRSVKSAPDGVAKRVRGAQRSVAEKRKRAQVNREVLGLRMR